MRLGFRVPGFGVQGFGFRVEALVEHKRCELSGFSRRRRPYRVATFQRFHVPLLLRVSRVRGPKGTMPPAPGDL